MRSFVLFLSLAASLFVPALARADFTITVDSTACAAVDGGLGGDVHTTGDYATEADCEAALPAAGSCIVYSCSGSGSTGASGAPADSVEQATTNALAHGIVSGNSMELGTGIMGLGAMALMAGLDAPPTPLTPAQIEAQREQQQRLIAAQQLNNSGLWCFQQGNFACAIHEFSLALEQTPDDATIATNLALAQQRLAFEQDKQQALGDLKGADAATALSQGDDFSLKQDPGLKNPAAAPADENALKEEPAPVQVRVQGQGGDQARKWDSLAAGLLGSGAPEARYGQPMGAPPVDSGGYASADAEAGKIFDQEADGTSAVRGWNPEEEAAEAQEDIAQGSGGVLLDQAGDKAKETVLDSVGESAGLDEAGGTLLNGIQGASALLSLAKGDTNEAGAKGVELVAGSLTWTSGMAYSGGKVVGGVAKNTLINVFDNINQASASMAPGGDASQSGRDFYNSVVNGMPRGCQVIAASVGMGADSAE